MTHDTLLDRYAHLTIRSGLNLQPGQQLLITAPLDAVPLVRRITEHAYRAGASIVTAFYSDDVTSLARYQFAADDTFDTAPGWLFNGMAEAFSRAVLPVSPSLAMIRHSSPDRTPRSCRAPTRPAPSPIARPWS